MESTRPTELSPKELGRLIDNLDMAMDRSALRKDNAESNSSRRERDAIHLQFPSDIWERFLEHCRQNELDPNQQITEAVASYYRDLLETYRIRARISADTSEMV